MNLPDAENAPANPGEVVSVRGSVVDIWFDVISGFEALSGERY